MRVVVRDIETMGLGARKDEEIGKGNGHAGCPGSGTKHNAPKQYSLGIEAYFDSLGRGGSCLTLSATVRQALIRSDKSLSSTSTAPSYSVRFRVS